MTTEEGTIEIDGKQHAASFSVSPYRIASYFVGLLLAFALGWFACYSTVEPIEVVRNHSVSSEMEHQLGVMLKSVRLKCQENPEDGYTELVDAAIKLTYTKLLSPNKPYIDQQRDYLLKSGPTGKAIVAADIKQFGQ